MAERFRVRAGKSLGEGGYGSVHPCTRIDVDGEVVGWDLAAKVCRIDPTDDPDEKRKRFRNGARIGMRLRHPNILRVQHLGSLSKSREPFLVMKLVSGGDLDSWLKDERSEEDVVAVFQDVLGAVAHAHNEGIVHRDITPKNILFDDGTPLVSDFDLAKDLSTTKVGPSLTKTAQGIGTPGYRAPEQWADLKRVGMPADVYALGRVLWRMLSREYPDDQTLDLHAVPVRYRSFIEKACEHKAHERYISAGEMRRAFDSVLAAPAGSPKDVAQKLILAWEDADTGAEAEALRQVSDHFLRNGDDRDLHYEVAPFMDLELLDAWAQEHPGGLVQVISAVHDFSEGPLPWDDCEVFARFFLRVFRTIKEPAVRQHCLERVLVIGESHNRYPVAYLLRASLSDVTDDEGVAVVIRAVNAQPRAAAWYHIPDTFDDRVVEVFGAADAPSAGHS